VNTHPHSRRIHSLGGALAAALLFGFPALADDAAPARPAPRGGQVGAAETTASPAWLASAREAMKRTGADGIALIVPAKTTDRQTLAKRLAELLESATSHDLRAALVSAVFVCVPAASVGALPGETAVLLGTRDGKRIAGCTLDLTDGKEFAAGVRRLLDTDDRFAQRVKTAQTQDVSADLAACAGDEAPALDARNRLIDAFESCGPAVIAAQRAASRQQAELRRAHESIVEMAFRRQVAAAEFGGQITALPFGAQWSHPPIGDAEPDPCPPCGMAVVRRSEKVLLDLLTKDPDGK
jgi:hypothetical protein